MLGLLNVNKPRGMTSREAVNHVQRLVHPVKVGHAGTLDPLASGVLVVCLGPATRLIQYIQRMPKAYLGTFLLGRTSDTDDLDGDVVELSEPVRPTRGQLEQAAAKLVGEIEQRPPAYSALKVRGRRAYDLARRGERIVLEPRRVTVHSIALLGYDYPEFQLRISCGRGVYVRSLGRDLAESLGASAVMSALVRTAVGEFRIDDACELSELDMDSLASHLLPPLRAVDSMPSLVLTDGEIQRVRQGGEIENRLIDATGEITACDSAGKLIAILVPCGQRCLRPRCNFLES